MNQEKVIKLIAAKVPVSDIASATGLTIEAILNFANSHKEEIADLVINDFDQKLDRENEMQRLQDLTIRMIPEKLKYADLRESIQLLEVLDRLDPLKRKDRLTDPSEMGKSNVSVTIQINDVLNKRLKNATLNPDGEIVAVNNRDMAPASIEQIKGIKDEYESKSGKSQRYLEAS